VVDDESKLAISLNVANFKPEELKVDLDGRILKIEGKQEVEGSEYSMRTFACQWALPDNVDVEQIKPSMTEDGHLRIEAPKLAKPSMMHPGGEEYI
ncbi:Hsp20/alpha crystallin family protein, partial [Necator americanus]